MGEGYLSIFFFCSLGIGDGCLEEVMVELRMSER